MRSPQSPQPPARSPNRPSTTAFTSTNLNPPVASTSRAPFFPKPEAVFEFHFHWNITGNFNDQIKVNKKVVSSLCEEVDSLTEVYVEKSMKSSVPGEVVIELAREAIAFEDAVMVKFRESLKKS
ncbi:hypothetical protein O181_043118 [Austropuccinia psidii MF-1]|uniref:Uncharacterized protein n=1 Tax=Austropuccinia psidii MF-1 TaxID=1389203 RepID=A0A9Q3DKP7_9BASI|nr:hypothetical protein [Austropuccinia psidii MF-1]